ncbi:MAG: hypothetical protein GYA17_13430 [Chloroflexi bacterium]|jgi:hypothetical protein|nr:hypothetical protein [Anaerolineaceae bacterium]NMB89356.1 hypothetical protein [Chloroflexota bacterium]
MTDSIYQVFAAYFDQWGIQLPEGALQRSQPGRLTAGGWTVRYLPGEDERGRYLDFYATHRMTNDRHVRIYASGETEMLPAYLEHVIYPENASQEQQRQAEGEYRQYNAQVTALLRQKGFVD